MNSLVELIFSAIGTQQAAAAVQGVDAAVQKLKASLAETNIVGVTAQKAMGTMSQAATSSAAALRSLRDRMVDNSATIRDVLTPHLEGATKQLLGMAAAALGVRAAYAGFRDAIADGANLEHLSQRTAESVRNLVLEETAFKNAGLGAGYLGTAVNLLDRALSPNAANAKQNAQIFRELGVSMDELRSTPFIDRIKALSAAFQQLPNQAERATVAMRLFGRYSGGQMLQLFTDPNAMAVAEQQAGRFADRMARVAPMFEDLQVRLNVVNLRLKEMWAAAAEQVLPALQSIASVFAGLNLSGVGTMIGMFGPLGGGGLASIVGVDMLDRALLSTVDKFKGRMTGAIAGVAATFTGALATALPYGLAAALAEQVVAGIIEAWADKQVQDILNHGKAVTAAVDPFREAGAKAKDQIDIQKNLEAAQKQLAEFRNELQKLDQKAARTVTVRRMEPGDLAPTVEHVSAATPADLERASVLRDAITKLQADIQNRYANPAAAADQIQQNALKALKASLDPLVSQLSELRNKNDTERLKNETPINRLGELGERRRSLETQLATPVAGLTDDEAEARRLSLGNQILEIKEKEKQAGQQIGEQLKQNADEEQRRRQFAMQTQLEVAQAAGNEELVAKLKKQIATEQAIYELHGADLQLAQQRIAAEDKIAQQQAAQRRATETMQAERTTLENVLNGVRSRLALVAADFATTDAEKWDKKKRELEEQVRILQEQIMADQKAALAARASGNLGAAATFEQGAASKGQQLASAKDASAQLGPNPNSVSEQLAAQSAALRTAMGTQAEAIGRTWQSLGNTMRSSLGDALYSMLSRTQNFRQAAGTSFLSLARSVGQSASQMAADWILKHTIMTAAHAAGEAGMTGATATGAASRTVIRIGETIVHGVQVGIRTALHLAGEVAQTAVTVAQSGQRIAATIAESFASIIKAAAGAMSAVASIPYVGPFLAIAAAAAMIAEGSSLIKGARETGGPVEAGSAYLVGEKRPEIFVPHSDGYIFPDAAAFSAPAPRSAAPTAAAPAGMRNALAAAAPSSGAGGSGNASMQQAPQHHYWLIDESVWRQRVKSDMYAVAHRVSMDNILKNS